MIAYFQTFNTPVGPFSVAVDADQRVLATAFGDAAALRSRFKVLDLRLNSSLTERSRRQVEAYFDGQAQRFDLPIAPQGSAFQQQVWRALLEIPFGHTRTYGDIATLLGSAPRPVGGAIARNPIALIVPCHRVVGSNGKLTGFAFGEIVKRQLLIHEEKPRSTQPKR